MGKEEILFECICPHCGSQTTTDKMDMGKAIERNREKREWPCPACGKKFTLEWSIVKEK